MLALGKSGPREERLSVIWRRTGPSAETSSIRIEARFGPRGRVFEDEYLSVDFCSLAVRLS